MQEKSITSKRCDCLRDTKHHFTQVFFSICSLRLQQLTEESAPQACEPKPEETEGRKRRRKRRESYGPTRWVKKPKGYHWRMLVMERCTLRNRGVKFLNHSTRPSLQFRGVVGHRLVIRDQNILPLFLYFIFVSSAQYLLRFVIFFFILHFPISAMINNTRFCVIHHDHQTCSVHR
jgi:hypothetical protein